MKKLMAVIASAMMICFSFVGQAFSLQPAANEVAPYFQSNGYSSSTVMLFDISGSMEDLDITNVSKLDAAKEAGGRILDIIQAENQAALGAEIGILSFSEAAWADASLSSDVNAARSALSGLYPHSGTGMADGLRAAIDQFKNKNSSKKVIILLSDGMPNIGLGSIQLNDENEIRQEIYNLAQEAGGKSICIYAVGFGIPNTVGNTTGEASIDEDFLKQVAAKSGCGAYYNARNATELANIYVELRHKTMGTVLFQKTGDIMQGQTLEITSADVSQGVDEMVFTLNWSGSRLDPTLIDPNGKVVDQNYPGASVFQSKSLASMIVQNPIPGKWTFKATGVEVPEGTLKYNAITSLRAPVQASMITAPIPVVAPSGSSAILVIVPLLIGAVMTYAIVISSKRAQSDVRAGQSARILIVSGQSAGRNVPLRDNMTIGRSRTASIYIPDTSVSRRHAQFRFSNGQWFIQDLGSSGGLYVNGAMVGAAPLRSGDQIRIGETELQFQSNV